MPENDRTLVACEQFLTIVQRMKRYNAKLTDGSSTCPERSVERVTAFAPAHAPATPPIPAPPPPPPSPAPAPALPP